MKKKTLLLCTLGLVASLQAQDSLAVKATPEAVVSNTTTETTTTAEPVATPTVADSAKTGEAPVSAVASTEASPESTAPVLANTPQDSAKQSVLPVSDTLVTNQEPPKDSVAQSQEIAKDTASVAKAAADSATIKETPKDSVVAQATPVADSSTTKVIADSVAKTDSATLAKAPVDSIKKEEKVPANKLGEIIHGNAYNSVGNEAAAATIGSNLASPHKMFGSKLAYFDPIAQQGALAFGDKQTYFLSFDNQNDLGLLTAGIAFGKFGFSIDYAMAKVWRYTDHADGSSETEKQTAPGTIIGGTASMNLGSFDVVLSGHYQTPNGNALLSLSNSEQEHAAWGADGYLGLSYGGDVIYWTLGVGAYRYDSKFKSKLTEIKVIDGKNYLATTKTSISDTLSNVQVLPEFSIGAAVLSSSNANVYLGLNADAALVMYDQIDGLSDRHNDAVLYLTPNILGEVMLSKYFMAFGGACFNWLAAEYSDRELNNEENKIVATSTVSSTVNLGARFEYGPVAVEMAFEKTFLENPFGSFSSTDGIVSSLGAFINF